MQTLFKKTRSGKIAYMNIETREEEIQPHYTIIKTTGTINSTKQSTSKTLIKSGKNVGRTNETSIKQQADKEALALWTSTLNKGYSTNQEDVAGRTYNIFPSGLYMPMLLNKFTSKFSEPVYAQRKYDGCRCLTQLDKNHGMSLVSRNGKSLNLKNIYKQVSALLEEQTNIPLDGELYKHGELLQDITSTVKNNDPKDELNYIIYDVPIEGLNFERRRNLLLSLDLTDYPNLKVDTGKLINSQDELDEFYADCLMNGYEGTIVCNPTGLYEFGFRTSDKSKIKPRVSSEFKCINHYFNKGKMIKQSTLICETMSGKTFHVKMKGNADKREAYAAQFVNKFKDRMVTVEYRKLSKEGVPLEAVGLTVRDYE